MINLQDLLREEGCLKALLSLLNEKDLSDATRVMLVQAIANMAVNAKNLHILQVHDWSTCAVVTHHD